MDVWSWIPNAIFGGFLGLLGQLVRGITTMKKVNDEADAVNADFGQLFDWTQYIQTAVIGIIAGVLASISVDLNKITPQAMLAVFAAGYSGADFFAAFLKKKAPTADQVKKFGLRATRTP